ncbi:MAG: hypothetical protein LBV68_02110 [Spirochaetaceae bacterium]|jgi:hypothetical protein|nr:hypothetical protein [Spirochaetaceae bacterium]
MARFKQFSLKNTVFNSFKAKNSGTGEPIGLYPAVLCDMIFTGISSNITAPFAVINIKAR